MKYYIMEMKIMGYNWGAVPEHFYGCYGGNVRDYCWIFGKEVGVIPFLIINLFFAILLIYLIYRWGVKK